MQRRILAVTVGAVVACIAIAATPALACNYESWLVAGAPTADGTVTVRGGGFPAGPVFFAWDRSDGPIVAEGQADGDGAVAIDLDLADGPASASKVIALTAEEGSPASPAAWAEVPVAAPIAPAVDAVPTGDSSWARHQEVVAAAGAGLLLLAAGAIAHRRRRRPPVMTTADLPTDFLPTGAGALPYEIDEGVEEVGTACR